MHILYIHQHFATPQGSTGTRSYEFARRWIKAGHKVTLITGYYDVGGLELGKGLIQKQSIEGINVVVVGTKYSNKQSYIRRIISFLAFCFFSIYAGLRVKNIDVVYATSTPLTVGIPAIVIKWLRRKKFVFEVRDQWPESVIEVGILKNKYLIKFFLFFEELVYRNSAAIVTLSDEMAKDIREIIKGWKPVYVVPNSSDLNLFRADIDASEIRKKNSWDDKLVFLHTGAMGKINDLSFVVRAAAKLKERDDIRFVLIGDGNQKPFLEGEIKRLELSNITLLPPVPKRQLAAILAACDIVMVIIGKFPIIEKHASLNKFYDGLSASKPLLLNYSGWQRELIEKHEVGFGCRLCDVDEFVEKVRYLSYHRDKLSHMGRQARVLAETQFSRDDAANLLEGILSGLI
jgi:glycosyltransferase involved in cell wall biosynthesis